MSRIFTQTVAVATTGGAGVATGSAVSEACAGFLLDVYLDYHASAPATTDVTISHTDPTLGTIASSTDNNTDTRLVPRDAITGGTDAFDRIPLTGTITVSVAQSDQLDPAVTATIRYLST